MPMPHHPLYDKHYPDWRMLEDCFEGERKVKEQGVIYLPPTPGQVLDGMSTPGKVGSCKLDAPGVVSYNNYKARAVFPDFFTEGVKTLVGILNEKPAKVTVPERMKPLLAKITKDGEGVNTLLRQIHFECLTTGRGGLLVDLPKQASTEPKPYIALYKALEILNWDEGAMNEGEDRLNLVVLDESGDKRQQDLTWCYQYQYRVLSLGPVAPDASLVGATYRQYVLEGQDTLPDDSKAVEPRVYDKPLDHIPFTFFGPVDLNAKPDQSPLLGLGNLCMHIYRSEADYRYTLFMQGQDTLVVVGGLVQTNQELPAGGAEPALRVGADARIDVQLNGDAKYIGVSSKGLPEMRQALNSDKELAAVRTGQLLAPGKMSMESGEALKTRVAAQTSTLSSVAIASASALSRALKDMALWLGEDPEAIVVEPNLDFSNYQIATQDLVQLITAKRLGYPLSMETLHHVAKERGVTNMTFDREVVQIRKDPPALVAIMQAQTSDTGNNPVNTAGGPKTPPKPVNDDGNKQD